ncbi:MAG: hypothetical protein ACREVL_14545 [Solimonas sp.]
MTCIVGIAERGVVQMRADSHTSIGDRRVRRAGASKVFSFRDFVIGCAGCMRLPQLMEHVFLPPHRAPRQDLMNYMVRDFVGELHTLLQENDLVWADRSPKSGTVLVGVAGRLFLIDGDLAVTESADGYDAIGSGAQAALGSLYSTGHLPATERLSVALEAAEAHCTTVRGSISRACNKDKKNV